MTTSSYWNTLHISNTKHVEEASCERSLLTTNTMKQWSLLVFQSQLYHKESGSTMENSCL